MEQKKFYSVRDEAENITKDGKVYFSPYEAEIFARKAEGIMKVLNRPCGITMNWQRIRMVLEIVEKIAWQCCEDGEIEVADPSKIQLMERARKLWLGE